MGFKDLTAGIHENVKSVFGEEIEYEPPSGGSLTITGIFNEKYFFVDPDTEQGISTNQPNVGIKLSDLDSPPVKGAFVTVRGVKYRVHDSREDGEGWTVLFLYKV